MSRRKSSLKKSLTIYLGITAVLTVLSFLILNIRSLEYSEEQFLLMIVLYAPALFLAGLILMLIEVVTGIETRYAFIFSPIVAITSLLMFLPMFLHMRTGRMRWFYIQILILLGHIIAVFAFFMIFNFQ